MTAVCTTLQSWNCWSMHWWYCNLYSSIKALCNTVISWTASLLNKKWSYLPIMLIWQFKLNHNCGCMCFFFRLKYQAMLKQ